MNSGPEGRRTVAGSEAKRNCRYRRRRERKPQRGVGAPARSGDAKRSFAALRCPSGVSGGSQSDPASPRVPTPQRGYRTCRRRYRQFASLPSNSQVDGGLDLRTRGSDTQAPEGARKGGRMAAETRPQGRAYRRCAAGPAEAGRTRLTRMSVLTDALRAGLLAGSHGRGGLTMLHCRLRSAGPAGPQKRAMVIGMEMKRC